MNWMKSALATLIMRGKITIEIPGLDETVLKETLRDAAAEQLREAAGIVCDECLTDKEKLDALADLLL